MTKAVADAPTAPNFLSVTPSPLFYEQDTKERLAVQKNGGILIATTKDFQH
jgi:hypothetical protein